jgi:hypothetical protein
MEATSEPEGRSSESSSYMALLDGELPDQVGRIFFVYDRRFRRQRGRRIDNRCQGLDVDSDQFGGILGLIATLRQDHGDGFTHMSDLAHGQHWLLRHMEAVPHLSSPLARQRQLGTGNWRRNAMEIRTGQHAHDPWHRCCASNLNRAYAAVRYLAPDKDGMQHAREGQVGDKLPLSGQKAKILPPLHRATDKSR